MSKHARGFRHFPSILRQRTGNIALFVVAGMFLPLASLRVPFCWATMKNPTWPIDEASINRKGRLGDGCYNVYLDVGANIGVHTRFLFEPDLYPDAIEARRIFDEEFGKFRDNRDICSFGFEPNPLHVPHQRKQEEAYIALGWRYHFIHAGVSDQDGNLTFYRLFSEDESTNNEWRFSMVKRRDDALPIQVPVIDFADWVKENVANRQIPQMVYGNYTKPKVVMKMDIEGSEFTVLPRLLFSGLMCDDIDFSFGELHLYDAWQMQRNATNAEEERGEIKFESEQDVTNWARWLLDKGFNSQALNGCPGRWRYLDDEAYVSDTTPLPVTSRDV